MLFDQLPRSVGGSVVYDNDFVRNAFCGQPAADRLERRCAQCRAQDATITAAQLADQLRFKNFAAARLQYGTLARAVAEKLGYTPPQKGKGPVRWWFALSTAGEGNDDAGDGQFKWVMRPELVAALRAMKWA